jgi:hypothetical protein
VHDLDRLFRSPDRLIEATDRDSRPIAIEGFTSSSVGPRRILLGDLLPAVDEASLLGDFLSM